MPSAQVFLVLARCLSDVAQGHRSVQFDDDAQHIVARFLGRKKTAAMAHDPQSGDVVEGRLRTLGDFTCERAKLLGHVTNRLLDRARDLKGPFWAEAHFLQ